MEVLTLNQCRTLRLHHATQMLRNVKAEVRLVSCCQTLYWQPQKWCVTAKVLLTQDFPRTTEEILKMEKTKVDYGKLKPKRHTPAFIDWHGK